LTLPLIRGRGNIYIREASPLFNSPLMYVSLKERGRNFVERGEAPLFHTLSLSFISGRGQESRLINILTQPPFVLAPAIGYN